MYILASSRTTKMLFLTNGAQVRRGPWPTLRRIHVYETIPDLHEQADTLLGRPVLQGIHDIESIARFYQHLEDVRYLTLIPLQTLGDIPKADCTTM